MSMKDVATTDLYMYAVNPHPFFRQSVDMKHVMYGSFLAVPDLGDFDSSKYRTQLAVRLKRRENKVYPLVNQQFVIEHGHRNC